MYGSDVSPHVKIVGGGSRSDTTLLSTSLAIRCHAKYKFGVVAPVPIGIVSSNDGPDMIERAELSWCPCVDFDSFW